MRNQALVSVVVLAYNASFTIAETLESIYNQDYEEIELVIADDCSVDNTVDVAKEWIEAHKERFAKCIISRQCKNRGVPANLNDGIRKASGKYIKIIASDDLLTADCISKNVDICKKNSYRYLFTWLRKFTENEGEKKIWDESPDISFFDSSAEKQYRRLLSGNIVYGCVFFAEKSFLEEMGLYNEEYTLMEDYPMWVKMTKSGYKLHFANIPTVLYRISDASLSNFVGTTAVNERYAICHKNFIKKEIIPPLLKSLRIVAAVKHWRTMFYHWLFVTLGNSRNKRSVRMAEYFYYRKYLRKKNS